MTNLCKWLIGLVITIYITSIGGLYKYLSGSNEQEVKNLDTRITLLQSQKEDVEAKLIDANNKAEICQAKIISENPAEIEISERLALMQKERDILIAKALSQSTHSIDPRSEIASHIALLKSESENNQASALNFLFEVRDPVTFKPLQDYFIKSESGHKPFIQIIHLWYELFLELNLSAGVEFVVNELSNANFYNSKVAFETLDKAVENKSIANEAKPNLETVALISDNDSARGYAKILLEKISNMDHETQ